MATKYTQWRMLELQQQVVSLQQEVVDLRGDLADAVDAWSALNDELLEIQSSTKEDPDWKDRITQVAATLGLPTGRHK